MTEQVVMRAMVAPVLALLLMSACRNPGTRGDDVTEVTRTRAGDIDVVVLSEDGAVDQGKDSLTLEFRRATDGTLVDIGTVKGSATMPMAGMAPMLGTVDVRAGSAPGRYLATSDLSMVGEWRLRIEWDGPAGRGSAGLAISAR